MGRARAFNEEEVLDKALEVFWKRGYEGASIQDLVQHLGVNRASLYAVWKDKAGLFAAVLERYHQRAAGALQASLAAPKAGRAAVKAYFDAVLCSATLPEWPKGCLVMNTVMTGTTVPPAMFDALAREVAHTQEQLRAALGRDKALARRRDLPALARFLAAEGHGLVFLARLGTPLCELQEAAALALQVLD